MPIRSSASGEGTDRPEKRLRALSVSRGIGIGKAIFLPGERRRFFRLDLNETQTSAELSRFQRAVEVALTELREMASTQPAADPSDAAGIFEVHSLILETSLAPRIETMIRERGVNAEWAIHTVAAGSIERQAATSDAALREKHLDIADIERRLLVCLTGDRPVNIAEPGAVVFSRELGPATIMELAAHEPAAFATEQGGWTSHSSILARELGIPMITGVRGIDAEALRDRVVIVDGLRGELILDPAPLTVSEYEGLRTSGPAVHHSNERAGPPAVISIRANVDKSEKYNDAKAAGATGIGLFRSESLIDRTGSVPGEEAQYQAYCEIADAAFPDCVNVRTFDVTIDQIEPQKAHAETNPALGLRSIRLSLARPGIFSAQLRAIIRASAGRKLDILLPLVAGVAELMAARSLIASEKAKLVADGIPAGDPKVGVMIETPSAIMTIDSIARKCDFLCLGTNDLVQYLLVVDRDNEAVADLYQSLHPAVIKSIDEAVHAAWRNNIPLSVCGEMAGSPFYVPVLAALGVSELSMNPRSIKQVRRILDVLDAPSLTRIAAAIRNHETAAESENYLRALYREKWQDRFESNILDA